MKKKKKFSAILTGVILILFCMVMSVTVNAAQKIPGRVKMVSAYSGSGLRISA